MESRRAAEHSRQRQRGAAEDRLQKFTKPVGTKGRNLLDLVRSKMNMYPDNEITTQEVGMVADEFSLLLARLWRVDTSSLTDNGKS